MRTEDLQVNGSVDTAREATDEERALRELARAHIERVRRLKLDAAAFLLGTVVLTAVWALTEYQNAGGWPERLSDDGMPGDWNPWILWVVLVWGTLVAIDAFRTWAHRPTTEDEIDREVARIRGRG